MTQSGPEFGSFGDIKPIGRRRRSIRWFRWLLLLLLLACVPSAWRGWNEFYDNLAEGDPPTIKLVRPPVGIGTQAVELRIDLSDPQSGLDEVIIRSEQSGDIRTLQLKNYPQKITEDTILLNIDAQSLGLQEGQAKIHITAFDRSFWSSSNRVSLDLLVDYKPPAIEVITTQHNAVRTGVELVFYRLLSDPKALSGATVGTTLFPGYPAQKLDAEYDSAPDVYFTFFAIPRDFVPESTSIKLLARDIVGNASSASIFYNVQGIERPTSRRIEFSQDWMETEVDLLYRKFLSTKASLESTAVPEFTPAIRNEERRERFQIVNVEYRALLERAIRPLFEHPKQQRYWKGRFNRPAGQKLAQKSGEIVEYLAAGNSLGSFLNEGMYFSHSGFEDVRSANDGIVSFSDELGPYGKTLIVDHGFGISSFYAHLSELFRVEGDRVSTGEVIGKVGSTGLVNSPTLLFQMRLNGMPVRIEEWLDQSWLSEHVEKKILQTKRKLGLRIRTVLE